MIPDRLTTALADRYRIERELGAGGMATVYLAHDVKHDRKVALKVLKPELAAVLGAERFIVEIKTTAALQHPHILPLFDSGEADGFLFYVMPFIDGETLRAKLDRETQLGVDEAVRIASDVAEALQYAHEHGVIHRDIKPENILLANGRPMVADFGIALALSAAAGGRMTETGLSLGTPHYMSPEQATAEKEISARSDVYSLASVCYEMLAGQPPHLGGSAQQIIMKIIAEPVAMVTQFRKSVPPNVAAALATALEKLPADRFASAQEFGAALMNPAYTSLQMSHAATAANAPSWLRDNRSIGALVVATAAILTLVFTGVRPSPSPGPTEYDVGLPDSSAMWPRWTAGFDVAQSGEFLLYQTVRDGTSEIWYRSLRDGTTRRIDGTENGSHPTLSPNGLRFAFVRNKLAAYTLEVMPVAGGTATVLGTGNTEPDVEWLPDGRVFVVDGDGNAARWFNPDGGPTEERRIGYCLNPEVVPTGNRILCGGGGNMSAYLLERRDSTEISHSLWTGAPDSTLVYGSNFRIVDARYLVYLSMGGDLLAAPVDLETRRVGRSVRMVSGVGRRDYIGVGSFDIAANGTLVYGQRVDHSVGHLVVADDRTVDTLPVGRDAFLRFAFTPDERRLAAVVATLEGEELRVYDLRTGERSTWVRYPVIRQPVWSPTGELLLFGAGDSVFIGSPDRSSAPERVAVLANARPEGFQWLHDDRVIVGDWNHFLVLSLDISKRPVTVDTLVSEASFPSVSPDGRWLAYNDVGGTSLLVSPLPATGERFQAATGPYEPQWLSSNEIAVSSGDSSVSLGQVPTIERIHMDLSGRIPTFQRRSWLALPEQVETAGQSYLISADGRVVYVRGTKDVSTKYLRVVPDWVARMKRVVDEANK